jgi:putative SOS response-associated peptidase YedK
MCGRFTLTTDLETLAALLGLDSVPAAFAPRYNIAPTQPVAAVPGGEKRVLTHFRWGLVPGWAKDPSIGRRLINARAETLAEKPSFRAAFRRRRCLIPADGFFEWKKDGKRKTPLYIRMKSGAPFALAGLWEHWAAPDGSELDTCAIVTTAPNELLAPIHDRMPVIFPPSSWDQWLVPGDARPEELAPLLVPYPSDGMETYEVSARINSPGYDGPELIRPVPATAAFL